MPLYEYQCDACAGRFEVIQKFSDAPPDTCRACGGGPVQRLISSPAIQFKGTGWYITDYSQKGKPAPESTAGETGETGEKGEKGEKGERKDSAKGQEKDAKATPADTPSSGAADKPAAAATGAAAPKTGATT